MAVLSDLVGCTVEEKAVIKADEWVRLSGTTREETRGRYHIEHRPTTRIDSGGINIPFRAWLDDDKVGFGQDGTAEWESLNIFNPPILVPDPEGEVVRSGTIEIGSDETKWIQWEEKYREDEVEALWLELFRVVEIVGKPGDNIIPGKTASTTTVVRPNAGSGTAPVDGLAERLAVDETFSTIRGGAGTNSSVTTADNVIVNLRASTTTDQYDQMSRGIFGFPTSAVGADDISLATLQINGTGKGNGLGDDEYAPVEVTPADEDDVVNGDYAIGNYGSTEFSSRITQSGWSTSGFNTFTLNASGIAYINGSGNTIFGIRSGWDLDNSFGGTWTSAGQTFIRGNYADEAGTVDDPVLTIEHAAAAHLPPDLAHRPLHQPLLAH